MREAMSVVGGMLLLCAMGCRSYTARYEDYGAGRAELEVGQIVIRLVGSWSDTTKNGRLISTKGSPYVLSIELSGQGSSPSRIAVDSLIIEGAHRRSAFTVDTLQLTETGGPDSGLWYLVGTVMGIDLPYEDYVIRGRVVVFDGNPKRYESFRIRMLRDYREERRTAAVSA